MSNSEKKKKKGPLPLNRIAPRQSSLINPASIPVSATEPEAKKKEYRSSSGSDAFEKGSPGSNDSRLDGGGGRTGSSESRLDGDHYNLISNEGFKAPQRSASSASNSTSIANHNPQRAFSSAATTSALSDNPSFQKKKKSSSKSKSNSNSNQYPAPPQESTSSNKQKRHVPPIPSSGPYSPNQTDFGGPRSLLQRKGSPLNNTSSNFSNSNLTQSSPLQSASYNPELDYRPNSRPISEVESISSSRAPNHSGGAGKGRTMQQLMSNLESKTKQDLLVVAKKMMAEINAKNRIINDTKTNEKWILAKLLTQESGGKPDKNNPYNNVDVSAEDREFLQTMMAFKAELGASKKQVEDFETQLLILEKKRKAAVQEAEYLRGIVDPKYSDPSNVQVFRIKELEELLESAINDYAAVQTKVTQWSRSSKRNQEARITAEASQRVFEQEALKFKEQLELGAKQEESLRNQISELSNLLKDQEMRAVKANGPSSKTAALDALLNTSHQNLVDDLQEKLKKSNADLKKSQEQYETDVNDLDARQIELNNIIDELRTRNRELEDSVGSSNEYQNIIKKRSSALFPLSLPDGRPLSFQAIPKPHQDHPNDQNIEREYQLLKEQFSNTEAENAQLHLSLKEMQEKLEKNALDYEKILQTLEDQEEMSLTMKEMENDKKALQAAYDTALVKLTQKQLSMEMLQKNVDRARDRLEPLQKTAEELDDLQDELAKERYLKDELQDKISILEEDGKMHQLKIMRLMDEIAKRNDSNFDTNAQFDEISELQDMVDEYKAINVTLTNKIEDQSGELEILQAQLNSKEAKQKAQTANDNIMRGFSISKTLGSAKGDESDAPLEGVPSEIEGITKELVKATATLAEQHLTIEQMEKIIGQDSEAIEELTDEKQKLIQKLKLMQDIRSNYDQQTAELENLTAKYKQLEQTKQNDKENDGTSLVDSVSEEKYRELEEKYIKENQVKKDLEFKLDQVEGELDFTQSELNYKIQQILKLEANIASLQDEIKKHQEQSNVAKNVPSENPKSNSLQLPKFDDNFSSSQEDLTQLVTKLDQAELQIEELKSELAAKKAESDEAMVNKAYQSSLYGQDMAEKVAKYEELASEFDQLEERLLQTTDEKNELERKHRAFVQELEEKHESLLQEKLDEIGSLEEKIQTLENKVIEGLDPERENQLQSEIIALQARIAELEQSTISESKLAVLESELHEIQYEIKEKEVMMKNLQDELLLKEKKISLLEKENSENAKNLAEEVTKSKSLIEKVEELKVQPKSKHSGENDAVEKELEEVKAYNTNLLDNIEQLETSLKEVKEQLTYYHKLTDDSLKLIDEYEDEILLLQNQKSKDNDSEVKVAALQRKLEVAEKEIVAAKSSIGKGGENDGKVADLEQMNEQLLGKIASLSQKMALQDNNRLSMNPAALISQQQGLDATRQDLDKVRQQLHEAVLKIASFQQEKADLCDELDDLRDHNMMLQSKLEDFK